MKARDAVLLSLRRSLQGTPVIPLPALEGDFVSYPSRLDQFSAAAELAHASVVSGKTHWLQALANLPIVVRSSSVLSLIDGFEGTVARNTISTPRRARGLDLTIAEGTLGVAESAAIWVPCQAIPQRSALFLAQHLVLVLDSRAIVPHLHAAYERLSVADQAFGCFIAGPSKTADIEQALVVGAHGPRSLTILLRESAP